MTLRRLLSLALLLVLAGPAPGRAACTLPAEAREVQRAARGQTECNDRVLKSGPASPCTPPPAPACAGTLVEDAIALAYGPNDPPAAAVDRRTMKEQLACQRQIGRAVSHFVGDKLRQLIDGRSRIDAEARARRLLDRLPEKCAVTVAADASGIVLPAVGSACQPVVGGAGATVRPEQLRDCLLTLLEVQVDQVAPVPPPVRPNLVIILSDDQPSDTLDATHETPVRPGPVMPIVTQRLVDQGVLFANAFVTTSLCCPSRASILKGQYAHITGVLTNVPPFGGAGRFDDASTLATWLDAAGYHTGLFGKYLNGYETLWTPPAPPYVPPGWDEWHAFEEPRYFDFHLIENGATQSRERNLYASGCTNYFACPGDAPGEDPCPAPQNYSTDLLLQKALDFIDESVGQPFLLYLAPFAPHDPACPAPRHLGLFDKVPPWRPPNYDEAGDESDKPQWVKNKCPMPQSQKDEVDALRRYMLGSLQAVDEAVGAIVDRLEALGIAEDTLVIYASDNGLSLGSHCHVPKACAYEECIRVPMVMRYPRLVPAPRTETAFGLNVDFALTLSEVAGLYPPIPPDGRSLVRVLAGTEKVWRADTLHENWSAFGFGPIPELAAVRTAEWKYVKYITGEKELYDLVNDPHELQNQAGNPLHAATEAALAARLGELRSDWWIP